MLVVCTFLLPGTSIPGPGVWTVFGLTFLIFAGAVVPVAMSVPRTGTRFTDFRARRELSRQSWGDIRGRIPRTVQAAIAVIFVLGWLSAMSVLVQVQGQPGRDGIRYFANDHGSLIPLTRAQYEHQLALGYRGFVSVGMMMCASIGLGLAGPSRPRNDRRA